MNVLVFMLCCFLTEDTFISFICVCVCVFCTKSMKAALPETDS